VGSLQLADYPIDRLPFVETTVGREVVRASYNGRLFRRAA